jgi:hypothetical protein
MKGISPWNKDTIGICKPNSGSFKKGMPKESHWNFGKHGPESPGYKNPEDRVSPLMEQIRKCRSMIDWKHEVKKIFNFTCQYCQIRGGILNSHHIKSVKELIKQYNITSLEEALLCESLWDLNNGICYCESCHKLLKNKGGLL